MTQTASDSQSFPRRSAATRNFRLGAPRTFTISPDGERVVFLRSAAGDDPVNRLWVLDVATGDERCVVQPSGLLGADDPADLPAEERARRERARESQGGIVAYATDTDVTMAAFALNGRLFHVGLLTERGAVEIEAPGGVNDPRPDPTGSSIAFVCGGTLYLASIDDGSVVELVGPEDDEELVTWGLPDFVAAEEMGRMRGYWWSPAGDELLVARVDESPVDTWFIADPENPGSEPQARRYPAAGTNNADVSLWRINLDLTMTEVEWDRDRYPYLADVSWNQGCDPLVTVQTRDQREVCTLTVNDDATTSVVLQQHDDVWVELVPGSPQRLSDGRIAAVIDDIDVDTRRLVVDGAPLTLPGFQVRAILDVDDDAVLLMGGHEPTESDVVSVSLDGGAMTTLNAGGGWHSARRRGGVTVLATQTIADTETRVNVIAAGEHTAIESFAESPSVDPHPTLLNAGDGELRTAVLFPTRHISGSRRLPVLMDPYGGPHAQRVLAAGAAFTTAQWWADQGFAVVICDGRGTPGRGPAFERSVHHDLAEGVLADQVEALEAAAERFPNDLDLARVAIRGWSFGGYLAALAVLKRPGTFHAAIAGAPVTDWALYDTHYTERYLGDPNEVPEVYGANSLIPLAPELTRPLMLIHGLADDNVVAAHTLRLSSALLAAGRPHTVLPLSGVTHMTPQEVVAENLLLLQVAFIKEALAIRE